MGNIRRSGVARNNVNHRDILKVNILSLLLAIGWFVVAAISLITQQPFEWYISALMCAALAINYTVDYIVGRSV